MTYFLPLKGPDIVLRRRGPPLPEYLSDVLKPHQNAFKTSYSLNHFFDAFLDHFWLYFASQLASQNPLKCVKNRCQDAFHLGLHFWIIFIGVCYQLEPSDPEKSSRRCSESMIFEICPFQVDIDF